MKSFGLVVSCFALAACQGDSILRPVRPALATSTTTQPANSCASADAVLGTLITLVRNATHVQAPAAEAELLPPLRTAHLALVAKPCDKQGALTPMRKFNTTVDANAGVLSSAQVVMFHSLANRIIGTINLVR
jgi:hypothetical protein